MLDKYILWNHGIITIDQNKLLDVEYVTLVIVVYRLKNEMLKFIHITNPISLQPEAEEEPADLYVYRFAEKKAELIGNVTRVMKEISVDCQLNIEQTNFTIDKLTQMVQNKDIQIKLSSNSNNKIPFTIGDKPFTAICDYMDNCNYKCYFLARYSYLCT